MLVEPTIAHLVQNLRADISTPFLHLGLEAGISARPKAEQILVLVSPKPLPHEEARKCYDALNDFDKYKSFRKAHKKAKSILLKHKASTGIAILNRPCGALDTDPKFQGAYRDESIRVGEIHALACLAAEVHVLMLAGTEHKKWRQYIGRGQYPKFVWRSVTQGKPVEGKYVCVHGSFWAEIYGIIDRIIVDNQTERYLPALEHLIQDVKQHLPPAESKLDVLNFDSTDVVLQSPKQARLGARLILEHFLRIKIYESRDFWTQYVRDEISKGGGKLFGWISAEEKAYLNVNLTQMMPEGISLNKFVSTQARDWSKFWNPPNFPKEGVIQAVTQLWHDARDIRNCENAYDVDPSKHIRYLDPKSFYDNVCAYTKTSTGSDFWRANADLAQLPFVSLGGIADAIDAQLKACTVPHQQLLNVNAILGKEEGCRTISKTPITWRMIGKCNTSISDWESAEAGSFDWAVKGQSALSAACLRNLVAEVAVILGFITGGLFNDFKKFFDTVDIPKLIENARKPISPSLTLH